MKNKKHAIIVIPTFNEKGNIRNLLSKIVEQRLNVKNVTLSVLIVDDSSPDGTAQIVKSFAQQVKGIYLLDKGTKEGLGAAYIRGFKYALEVLKADIVFEMDADFSHNPTDIPRFINEIQKGKTFVIGSRYVKGGSIPEEWPLLRRLNSKFGNLFARFIAGLGDIKDCTSGFRAISRELLRKIDLDNLGVKGYSFQMNLLYAALQTKAKISEIPIQFEDRIFGTSKLSRKDVVEFIFNAFYIRYRSLEKYVIVFFGIAASVAAFITLIVLHASGYIQYHSLLDICILLMSLLMSIQGLVSLLWMIYGWEDPEKIDQHRSPQSFLPSQYSFTAIIPVKDEEHVIADTIRSVQTIDYPSHLKEVLIVCHKKDTNTIHKINTTLNSLGANSVKLITFDSDKTSKPHGLNIGLRHASKDIVAVFDAEDRPHKDIFHVVNTVMRKENADVVQSGVQLMNYHSRWFAPLNVLEYFFWFKSTLHFFSNVGIIPLAGNTVFFKKYWLKRINGWDEKCLTEDADIGIRLSLAGAKTQVVYDEKHVTREEVPTDIKNFIMQRTRWNQGFIQILAKGDWMKLPKLSQKMLAGYILVVPEIQALSFLLIPFSLFAAIDFKLPVTAALLTLVPFMILLLELVTYNIGMYEFIQSYGMKFKILTPLKIIIFFYPFQLLLGFSALRAVVRTIRAHKNWEKTYHINAHEELIILQPNYNTALD